MKWLIRHQAPALIIIDLVAFQLALLLSYFFRFRAGVFENPLQPYLLPAAVALSLFWLILYLFCGLYRTGISTSRYEAFAEVAKCCFIGFIILFVLLADKNISSATSKFVLISYVAAIIALSGGGRALFRNLIRKCFRKGIGSYNALLIGFGKRGRKLFRTLNETPEFGYNVTTISIVEESEKPRIPERIKNIDLDNLKAFLDSDNNIEFILISMEPSNRKKVLEIMDLISRYDVRMMIIPDFFQILSGLVRSQQLYGVPLMEVFPQLMSPFTQVVKRVMDIAVSLTVLVIGLPIMFLVAIAVKLDSKGPVFYKQKRVGYRGREFNIYKFRSMVQDAESKTGAVWAKNKDTRITRVGAFIRQTRLDEIPQAFNVLRGDMSLVGPRPERRVFVDEFIKKIAFYNRRHNVKPGITGWAQIRRGYDATIDDVREKLPYDLFYLENISIGLDIKIMINTIWVMLTFRGR